MLGYAVISLSPSPFCSLILSVESHAGAMSTEAFATRVDIMDGVRNFRPRQVNTMIPLTAVVTLTLKLSVLTGFNVLIF